MRDDFVIHDAWDFGDIAALLKLWGIPFDVLRLDTHTLGEADFLDADGRPKYGAIVWTARGQKDHPWRRQDYGIAARAVTKLHIGFIAVGNKIQEPPIQDVLGLRYAGFTEEAVPVAATASGHFITRGMEKETVPAEQAFEEGEAVVEIAAKDVAILALAGGRPQLTARTLDPASRTRAVWIGGDPDLVFHASPFFIRVLRRALVWVMGYGFYKDYEKTVVLRMDDPGSSQSAYFQGWDYAQLDEAAIRDSILAPLRARGARLGVAFCPGYPWIPDRSIRRSAALDFIDPRGVRQNIVSTRAGLLAGMSEGLIEVQSHGLTHMAPDLSMPPPDGKSWWDGSWTVEWPDERWYREFRDERHGRDIDAAVQLELLRRSADWIADDFGRRPLVFIPGGHSISGDEFAEGDGPVPPHIAANYTYKLAAEAGYGLGLDLGAHYLGRDRVISLDVCWSQDPAGNFARGVPAVLYFHDKDVRQKTGFLAGLLETIDPQASFLGMDEWVAYLHASPAVAAGAAGGLDLSVESDPVYGRYFETHPSTWTFHLSDELRAELDARAGRPGWSERRTVTVPAGPGKRVVRLAPEELE